MAAYLFQSERLGFRNWEEQDFEAMIKISANPTVMEHFPAPATAEQTIVFLHKMQQLYIEKKYCYFACFELTSDRLIGFIGLADKTFESSFTPAVDIGWRLSPEFWGKGYATEGAKKCLDYGFQQLNLSSIIATAPIVNTKSIQVMKNCKMEKVTEFQHPLLTEYPRISLCVCYEKTNPLSR